MNISTTKPIEDSWNWTKLMLFKDFSLSKWFTIGFCAFLAALGKESGININFPTNLSGKNVFGQDINISQISEKIKQFVMQNLTIILTIVSIIIILAIIISILVQWISSRGKFMFLDCIVNNKAAVIEPWKKYKSLGNSLFLFKFCLSFIYSVLCILTIALSIWIAWSDITSRQFTDTGVKAILIGAVPLLLITLNYILIHEVVSDFCVPIMYIKNVGILESISLFFKKIFPGHFWIITLFYLVKYILFMIIAVGIVFLTICTCCIFLIIFVIPYLGSVLLLPASVFIRCYSLFFLEQFGEEWKLFNKAEDAAKVFE